jgi:FMN phosphatase YigB (HAD superfamily)
MPMGARFVQSDFFRITDKGCTAASSPSPSSSLASPVRGVVLEPDELLYDDTVWRQWLLRLLGQLGLHTHYRIFFRVWDLEYLDAVHRGQRTFREAMEAFLLSAGLSRGQVEEVQASCYLRRREWEEATRPLPGVKTALAQLLSQGVVLGLLCNSEYSAEQIHTQLAQLGMGAWFHAILSSHDLGRAMPDAECYQTMTVEMELAASEIAFVGHDAARLAGAAAAGMATIAFHADPEVETDGVLERFQDLPDVLKPTQPRLAVAG